MTATAKRDSKLSWFADIMLILMGRQGEILRTAELMRGAKPAAQAAELDAHTAVLKSHLDAIEDALTALPDQAITRLRSLSASQPDAPVPIETGANKTIDTMASQLISHLEFCPDNARRLAEKTARLLEDSASLQPGARRRMPLGRGFESLFNERLRHRLAFMPDQLDYLVTLQRHLMLLLEEPDQGRLAIECDLGAPLTADERLWLDSERRVATLRFVRKSKTEEGHIRWFVRPDPMHDFVLDRSGMRGHWIICGNQNETDLAKIGAAVERVTYSPTQITQIGWKIVEVHADAANKEVTEHTLSEPSPILSEASAFPLLADDVYRVPEGLMSEQDMTILRGKVRSALVSSAGSSVATTNQMKFSPHSCADISLRVLESLSTPSPALTPNAGDRVKCFALKGHHQELQVIARRSDGSEHLVKQVPYEPEESDLLAFLESMDRVANLAPIRDEIDNQGQGASAIQWARALLDIVRERENRGAQYLRSPRVCLVYIPSSIPYFRGGTPFIGLDFLRDRLERAGMHVNILKIPPSKFDARLVELLGADVIGIGVYIHNRDDVANLVARLRQSGYRGKLILGGPEARNIDSIQATIHGWDAIVRGEAEEVLPRVLETLDCFGSGRWSEGLTQARTLSGVVLKVGNAVLLCETAAKNRASEIICPLPFDWSRGNHDRRLQMNFTRGCPYQCTFCPNHQGRLFHSGRPNELWRFTVLAISDNLGLPLDVEEQVARSIQAKLRVEAAPNLRIALHMLLKMPIDKETMVDVCTPLDAVIDPTVATISATQHALVGMEHTLDDQLRSLEAGQITPWKAKETWLIAKLAVLASRQLWRRTRRHNSVLKQLEQRVKPAFVLETSEDNTLVNRASITEYLARRRHYGLTGDFIFNPGQNTVWDLTDKNGGADEAYIAQLVEENPFAVALGVDGSSNAVIRQNRKPLYRIQEVLAVNRALARHRIEVANNYILLTPETDLLEAIEAFTLFLLLPIPWREYGPAINLRVIKEEMTLSYDEGVLFAPEDQGFDVPLRFDEVQQMLDRWSVTSQITGAAFQSILWKILEEDRQASSRLPLVIERWEHDFDSDAELVALAQLIRSYSRPDVPLVQTLKTVQGRLKRNFLAS